MNILVIDGMGGGIGKSIIEHIKGEFADAKITAVGTNSIATSAMLNVTLRCQSPFPDVWYFFSLKKEK